MNTWMSFKNIFLKKIIITITACIMLVVTVSSASMQELEDVGPVVEPVMEEIIIEVSAEDIEDTMSQLEVYHSGFLVVRDEFFADQSEGNKVRYHKAGFDWAMHLLEAHLQYIDYQQVSLYNSLENKGNLKADWLQAEHDLLAEYEEKIDDSNDYVELRGVMADYNEDWQIMKHKINYVKVLVFIDKQYSLVTKARLIYDKLDLQNQITKSTLESSDVEDIDFSVFEQIFITYFEKLSEIKDALSEIKGDIDEPREFTFFDSDDEIWQGIQSSVNTIKTELSTLSALQGNGIIQFINILNTPVVPANKPLP